MQAITTSTRCIAFRSTRFIPRPLSTNNHHNTRKFTQPTHGVFMVRTTITRNMSSSPTYTVDYLSGKIQKELQAEHVDIEDLSNCGCGMKFDAVIVSPQFEGKPILQRQRLVNQTLAEEMKHIHAFTMRTLTPSQWKENQSKKEQGSP